MTMTLMLWSESASALLMGDSLARRVRTVWSGATRTAAADFNYFALGTRMYVKNNRYDFGYRVVEETGSNFDPWEIALWMPADDPNAALMTAEGYVYDMEVYILD